MLLFEGTLQRAAVPEQARKDASLEVEVTLRDRGAHNHLPETRNNITGPVETALGEVPVPEVTPVEEALRRA